MQYQLLKIVPHYSQFMVTTLYNSLSILSFSKPGILPQGLDKKLPLHSQIYTFLKAPVQADRRQIENNFTNKLCKYARLKGVKWYII